MLLNELEQQVLAAIGGEATPIDQIIAETGLPVQQVLSTLSVLEIRRLVRRLSGTTVAPALMVDSAPPWGRIRLMLRPSLPPFGFGWKAAWCFWN